MLLILCVGALNGLLCREISPNDESDGSLRVLLSVVFEVVVRAIVVLLIYCVFALNGLLCKDFYPNDEPGGLSRVLGRCVDGA